MEEPTDREILERAAARLDKLLADVTTGRWQVDGSWAHAGGEQTRMITAGEDRVAVALGVPDLGTGRGSTPDLAYIAGMGPTVGRALVRWLQAAARDADRVRPTDPWALAVAREILGDGR